MNKVRTECCRIGLWYYGGTCLVKSYVWGIHHSMKFVIQSIVLSQQGLYDTELVTCGAEPAEVLRIYRQCGRPISMRYFRKKDRFFSFRDDKSGALLRQYLLMNEKLAYIKTPMDSVGRAQILSDALAMRGCIHRDDSVICENFIRGGGTVSVVVNMMAEAQFKYVEGVHDPDDNISQLAAEYGYYPGIIRDARELAMSEWLEDLGEMPLLFPWEYS
jgi:hypothetical protein